MQEVQVKKKKKKEARHRRSKRKCKPNGALMGDLLREIFFDTFWIHCLGYICYCFGLGFDVLKIVLYGTFVFSIH